MVIPGWYDKDMTGTSTLTPPAVDPITGAPIGGKPGGDPKGPWAPPQIVHFKAAVPDTALTTQTAGKPTADVGVVSFFHALVLAGLPENKDVPSDDLLKKATDVKKWNTQDFGVGLAVFEGAQKLGASPIISGGLALLAAAADKVFGHPSHNNGPHYPFVLYTTDATIGTQTAWSVIQEKDKTLSFVQGTVDAKTGAFKAIKSPKLEDGTKLPSAEFITLVDTGTSTHYTGQVTPMMLAVATPPGKETEIVSKFITASPYSADAQINKEAPKPKEIKRDNPDASTLYMTSPAVWAGLSDPTSARQMIDMLTRFGGTQDARRHQFQLLTYDVNGNPIPWDIDSSTDPNKPTLFSARIGGQNEALTADQLVAALNDPSKMQVGKFAIVSNDDDYTKHLAGLETDQLKIKNGVDGNPISSHKVGKDFRPISEPAPGVAPSGGAAPSQVQIDTAKSIRDLARDYWHNTDSDPKESQPLNETGARKKGTWDNFPEGPMKRNIANTVQSLRDKGMSGDALFDSPEFMAELHRNLTGRDFADLNNKLNKAGQAGEIAAKRYADEHKTVVMRTDAPRKEAEPGRKLSLLKNPTPGTGRQTNVPMTPASTTPAADTPEPDLTAGLPPIKTNLEKLYQADPLIAKTLRTNMINGDKLDDFEVMLYNNKAVMAEFTALDPAKQQQAQRTWHHIQNEVTDLQKKNSTGYQMLKISLNDDKTWAAIVTPPIGAGAPTPGGQ